MRISDWSSDVCSSDLAPLAMTGMEQSSYPRRRFHILGHRAHLRRHITLVMLRKDAVGDENPVGAHPAVGDHAALLAEQVRNDALIFDRHRRLAVGRDETDRQAIRLPRNAALSDHAAKPHRLPDLSLAVLNLDRRANTGRTAR